MNNAPSILTKFLRAFNCNIVLVFIILLTGCTVQSPKYSTLKQVMTLHIGMSKNEVEDVLGVQPYNIKSRNATSDTYIYVYRVIDRRTISFYTKPVNGVEAIGKYVQLAVTYSKGSKLISLESCNLCPDNLVTKSNIDFEKVLVFVTVTLPVLLIYFGLKR